MKNILRYRYLLFAWFVVQHGLAQQGQTNIACKNLSSEVFYTGEVFFSNGSSSNAFNATRRMNTTIGQVVIGESFNQDYNSGFGFWSNLLLAPSAPTVICSEGDLPDRINVTWEPDPLSPAASGGFNIYRDGVLLSTEDADVRSFVDFNVISGQFYTYSVAGKSQFGEGYKGASLGFLNPNGVVTGQVKTYSGNPVVGAAVTLSPTIGTALEFDGDASLFASYVPALSPDQFTVSCWVKLGAGNNASGILDLGSSIGKNWWLQTTGTGTKGVAFNMGNGVGNTTTLSHVFDAASADAWHYVAATYNGSSLLLYVDGELIQTAVGAMQTDSMTLFMGQKGNNTGFLHGKIDEVRIFDRQLAQTELQMFMNSTVPADADGLQAYWKFDEGVGSKGFDQTVNKIKTYLCGVSWTNDKPEVVNTGITDETGFYNIGGVNYGAGTTFTAKPSKTFFFNQSLEFNGVNENYADLTDFDLADSSTVTLTVKAFDFSGNQALLSKSDGADNVFVLCLNNGNLDLIAGGTTHSFGALGMGFHHLAITLRQFGGSLEAILYKDGTLVGSNIFTGIPTNWSGLPWKLGAKADGAGQAGFFTGLIDEAAFFNTLIGLPDIQEFANIGTDVSHIALTNYFNLNEGSGTSLTDMGTALSGHGTTHGTGWSSVAAITQTLEHKFTPSSRLVTLNPTSTSTDGVDFTDQSTVPVSGYVRFDGTTCFADSVEILVNGLSLSPPVFTNADGKFIVDFEPGGSAQLSPKYKNHQFYPAFWEIVKVSTPVSGILFRDMTKRTITGQMAGGDCRKSVITPADIVKVKVESLDGCYSKTLDLVNENGKFTFTNLPPKRLTVAVVQHTDPSIYSYFQLQGGSTVDLSEKNDTTDFIYYSDPVVEMTSLDTNQCGAKMLSQAGKYTVKIKVYQDYPGGKCYLDSAALKIQNLIANAPQKDTTMRGGQFTYKFKAGLPELTPPYLKTLQVTAKANNREASAVQQAVVLGIRPRSEAFVTTSPEIPVMVVHDPPGDASFAYWEKDSQVCADWSFETVKDEGHGVHEKVSVGPNWEIAVGFVGFLTKTDGDVVAEEEGDFVWSKSQTDLKSTTVCFSTNEILSTESDDLLVGADADVFMGGALNMVYGVTDKLVFDTANCAFKIVISSIVTPKGFATTYIYSRYHILNSIIPDLLALPTPDLKGVASWRNIIKEDSLNQASATFDKNLSFNGGLSYESSTTNENGKSSTHSLGEMVDKDVLAQLGFFANDVGASAGVHWNLHTEATTTTGNDTTTTTTAGYVLSDDDPGDNFTVDVLKDKKYGTSVFKTRSGQSSCPYEKNTQPREEVAISVDKVSDTNVPENGEAVFKFTLGNISQSNDTREYLFSLIPESNPNGAVVKINGGSPLDRPFGIEAFKSQEVIVTVARGPVDHVYEDLEFAIFSECEDARGVALGLSALDPKFYKSVLLDVTFVEPCSPVDIGFPLQDWVLTPADGDILNVVANNYDENDSDLELIRAQYRRSQGDGAWINIAEVPKADLGPIFEVIPWDTDGLQDGFYEVRTVTQCTGGQNPGISHVMKGKIERTPPEIFGTPQPADGVLSAGDEISIQFSEPIRCDLLIQADFFNNNNVGLYDTETGDLIDATITCQDDKIIIVPNVPNQFMENKVLRVEVDDIRDLAGNSFVHGEWEFVVDRNPINWVDQSAVKVVKYEEDFVSITRKLENRGGQATEYTLTGIPDWVRVFPKAGTLAPGGVQVITFEFDSIMPFGPYADTLLAEAAQGNEPLALDARVVCHTPVWPFNPASYLYSSNMTLELNIEGIPSTDEEDQVAAFIGGELRGLAKVQYVPAVDKYLAFLTVYSDDFSGGDVELQIWDASACALFGEVVEDFVFEADDLIGTPTMPQIVHTNSQVLRKIPLHGGWNWLSFNLAFPDASPNAVFASLSNPENDLVKSQTQFSQNYSGLGWLGSLSALGNTSMYQYRTAEPDTMSMIGSPIDPATLPIPVVTGWNWIGYLPQYPLPVNLALATLTNLNGDLIKSQTQFAQFVSGFGWIGNLAYLEAPNGYLLKMATPGAITYPVQALMPGAAAERGVKETTLNLWSVDATNFELNSTLIGILQDANGQNVTAENLELGAFVGGEVRGSAKALYIEPLGVWMFFLTSYANTPGELLHFKLFDGSQVSELAETLYFTADAQQGTVQAPFVFGSPTTLTQMPGLQTAHYLDVQPNPLHEQTTFHFSTGRAELVNVTVSDALGTVLLRSRLQVQPGDNQLAWDARTDAGRKLPAGIYFVKMEGEKEGMVLVKKMVIE